MAICQLGYIGVGAADLDNWTVLLSGALGLQALAPETGSEPLRFRWDNHDSRLFVHPDSSDDLLYLGWQVDTPGDLETVCEAVSAAGIEVHEGDAGIAELRRVRQLVWFRDPEGLRTEVCYAPLTRSDPLTPGRPHHGFVAGNLGAGHVVVSADDRDGTARFYTDTLGFKLSDVGRGRLAFMRCNSRHHSLALMPTGTIESSKRLVHFMIQVQELDDVGVAFDSCLDVGAPLVTTIGRHTNDRSVSFYVRTPAGFEIEYGWGSIEIDEATWEAAQYATGLVWGQHQISDLAGLLRDRTSQW